MQDNGGTADGGADLDPTPNTVTFNVTPVNDPPAGTSKTITMLEDATYTFTMADFGYSDPNDTPPNVFIAVKITTVPGAGTLALGGVPVTVGQSIPVGSVNSGNLRYTPVANANGFSYASFKFQVQDDGGTANGGVDLDQSANTLDFDVTAVNDPPTGADITITTLEDNIYTFSTADFGFSDPDDVPPNILLAVKITTLPAAGALDLNGVHVGAGQFIPATSIAAGNLRFTPAANANGLSYTSFTFQVQDNGGTANGGVDLDPVPHTVTIDVTAVNDPPAGTDKIITTLEDTTYNFSASDFGFTDPNDIPPNTLFAVKITTLPGAGMLALSGVGVTAGQFIPVAGINAGNLKFTPVANANGVSYASFTFQVQDNGGTANGGADLDPTPNTININVTSINDPPAGTDMTITTLEDTAYTFFAADFGYSDPNDTPPNALLAVKITTLPAAGALKLSGVDVTAGQFISVTNINSANLTFTPAPDDNGVGYASFTFQVQDNGGTLNGGVDLDPTPNTITINVTPVNDAPVLDPSKSPVLNDELQDSGAPIGAVGTLVSSLVDFAVPPGQVDNVTDVDSGALLGIAVVDADVTNGSWFFSLNNGAAWNALGTPSTASARLLAADSGTRLYFQPNPGFTGTLTGAITLRAWDQTTGTNGTTANTTVNGGTTAF